MHLRILVFFPADRVVRQVKNKNTFHGDANEYANVFNAYFYMFRCLKCVEVIYRVYNLLFFENSRIFKRIFLRINVE